MDKEKVKNIVTPIVESYGAEIVSIAWRYVPGGFACRIDVDRKLEGPVPAPYRGSGLDVGALEAISREVMAALGAYDVAAGKVGLEVSTPGLDRPIARPADFDLFVGHRMRIVLRYPLDGRRRFAGRLASVAVGEDGARTLVLETEEGPRALAVADIEEARLVPELPRPGQKKILNRKGR